MKKIADYLATRGRLDADFRRWLRSASVGQVRDFLLAPFAWETRAEAVEFVERAMMRKVNAMAAKKRESLPPSVTGRVVRRLFDEVWKVLRRTDLGSRFLDSLRIEELWEEETKVSLPQGDVEALLRAVATTAPRATASAEEFRRGAPPIPDAVCRREELVREVQRLLNSRGFMNIHGSTRWGRQPWPNWRLSMTMASGFGGLCVSGTWRKSKEGSGC